MKKVSFCIENRQIKELEEWSKTSSIPVLALFRRAIDATNGYHRREVEELAEFGNGKRLEVSSYVRRGGWGTT